MIAVKLDVLTGVRTSTVRSAMQAERHIQVLGCGPQDVVVRQKVPLLLNGVIGDHCPNEPPASRNAPTP